MPALSGVRYSTYATGDELSAAEMQTYVANQVVMSFANEAARDSALSGSLVEGMVAYLQDVEYPTIYDGTSWIRYARTQDVAAVDTRTTLINQFTTI
jgi:hypothetical protein